MGKKDNIIFFRGSRNFARLRSSKTRLKFWQKFWQCGYKAKFKKQLKWISSNYISSIKFPVETPGDTYIFIRKYQEISGNTCQFQEILGYIRKYQQISGNTCKFQEILGNTRKYQEILGNTLDELDKQTILFCS
jgi:hypothetical protein